MLWDSSAVLALLLTSPGFARVMPDIHVDAYRFSVQGSDVGQDWNGKLSTRSETRVSCLICRHFSGRLGVAYQRYRKRCRACTVAWRHPTTEARMKSDQEDDRGGGSALVDDEAEAFVDGDDQVGGFGTEFLPQAVDDDSRVVAVGGVGERLADLLVGTRTAGAPEE